MTELPFPEAGRLVDAALHADALAHVEKVFAPPRREASPSAPTQGLTPSEKSMATAPLREWVERTFSPRGPDDLNDLDAVPVLVDVEGHAAVPLTVPVLIAAFQAAAEGDTRSLSYSAALEEARTTLRAPDVDAVVDEVTEQSRARVRAARARRERVAAEQTQRALLRELLSEAVAAARIEQPRPSRPPRRAWMRRPVAVRVAATSG